jgi:hypothetical protein
LGRGLRQANISDNFGKPSDTPANSPTQALNARSDSKGPHMQSQSIYDLSWHRNGAAWVLLHKRRRMRRVVPDSNHPGMWRSAKSGRRLSDMANLSWAKNAVLVAAELELAFEDRQRRANDPRKSQQIAGYLPATSSLVRQTKISEGGDGKAAQPFLASQNKGEVA